MSAVETGAATDVTQTSATLNGEVNPEGTDSTAYFQYGLSTDYSFSTPAQNIGSGSDPVAVEADISGLLKGREYHFRVVRSGPDVDAPVLVGASWS